MPNKYGAKRVQVDGIWFDSKAEARRYGTLKMLEKAKNSKIRDLKTHPKFELWANGVLICIYTLDFQYTEIDGYNNSLGIIVEDVKSPTTAKKADYKLRVKLFKANYPSIEFREIKGS